MTPGKRVMLKVIEAVPDRLKQVIYLTPAAVQEKVLERLFNKIFYTHYTQGEMNFLTGRRALIQVSDINLNFAITLEDRRLRIVSSDKEPDVCFRAGFHDLLLLAAGKTDPDSLFFRRRLLLSGDTELGLAIKNFLDRLETEKLFPFGMHRLLAGAADLLEANRLQPI